MKLGIIISLLIVSLISATKYEILPYNPVANTSATVKSGNARFTILTPQLIRMEYSASRNFVDQATVTMVNRNLPVPSFKTSQSNGFLVITTDELELSYKVGGVFSADNLKVRSLKANPSFNWAFGMKNDGNLLGTIKSLDGLDAINLNCDVNGNVHINGESLHCEWGLISKAGWAIVNDSANWLLDDNDWWTVENPNTHDLYFMGHGLDFKKALYEYTLIAGKISMFPKYASGIMWSRWYNFNNLDVKNVVNEYITRAIPLDVFILDMDWHSKQGWGGYSFDRNLFPIPEATLTGYLKRIGLHTSINLHDDDGVRPTEDKYVDLAKFMGLDPSKAVTIPFTMINQTYVIGLEDIVLRDLEKKGVDFMWIDWQQGGKEGGCAGGKQNPTIWLNKIRSTDPKRRGDDTRGLVLARWGGLGTHRYQVGFSGDVAHLTWANLAYQPYFSATSSNVGYGFWSHDLVGPHDDHELHTRWIQWGAFSAIFRTHDRGMASGGCANTDSCAIVEIWEVPTKNYEINREAMIAREQLIPYIYNATRQAFDTGISLIRPMYYDYPTLAAAYKGDASFSQYMFGDHMMIAPITTPVSTNNSMASSTIWIPPGYWVERDTGALHFGASDGSTYLTKLYDLSEIPIFIRGGAIIPSINVRPGDVIGIAQRQYTSLTFSIYPGASQFSTKIYEDDGKTTAYLNNQFAWTNIKYTRTSTSMLITISTTGSYPEFPDYRLYTIKLVNYIAPTAVVGNGIKYKYSANGGRDTWTYDGVEFTTIIESGLISTGDTLTIQVQNQGVDDNYFSGLKGVVKHSNLAKRNLDKAWNTPGSQIIAGGNLSACAATGDLLTYLAGTDYNQYVKVLFNLKNMLTAAIKDVNDIKPAPYGLFQLWSDSRNDNCLCGTQKCVEAQSGYVRLRIEGYCAKSTTPNAVKLLDYWNAGITDNYATTTTSTPTGYTPADFENGYVLKSYVQGTVPLKLYWSDARKDMLTVASAEGIAYATQNNYTLMNNNLGYVYTNPQLDDGAPTYSNWIYSMELLLNALN